MQSLKKFFRVLLSLVQLILAVSFLFMILNVSFYYGFHSSVIHTTQNLVNPFGMTVPLIWSVHLIVGFLAGMGFSKKRFLLAGSMGLLCAFLITGVSLLYFGWREDLMSVEMLIPLLAGILPSVKLYDYLNEKYPAESQKGQQAK